MSVKRKQLYGEQGAEASGDVSLTAQLSLLISLKFNKIQ